MNPFGYSNVSGSVDMWRPAGTTKLTTGRSIMSQRFGVAFIELGSVPEPISSATGQPKLTLALVNTSNPERLRPMGISPTPTRAAYYCAHCDSDPRVRATLT